MSPIILATPPRDAVSPGVVTSAGDKLPTVFNDREGVEPSPLGGESKDENHKLNAQNTDIKKVSNDE